MNELEQRLIDSEHWAPEEPSCNAHIAEHLGMIPPGDKWPKDLTGDQVLEYFRSLSPGAQVACVRDIEECPW